MKFGFAKQDITPRLGVGLFGYSGYLNRYATAVRDKLWARCMAVSDGKNTAVIVSCDLVFTPAVITSEVRRLVKKETGIAEHCIMVHATHTHSGPYIPSSNRVAYDPPYIEILPERISRACVDAVQNMQEAELKHVEVPCEGIGVNRVYEKFNYFEKGLEPDFKPEKPDLTDTSVHVFTVATKQKILGFISYFGCHNVVGGAGSTYIHGDFAGIATGRLEREIPGATGLFLLGAHGDVNTACCCMGNDNVLQALDIISDRYAEAVRRGIATAAPLKADVLRMILKKAIFSHKSADIHALRKYLAKEEALIRQPSASDEDPLLRNAVLRARSLRYIIKRVENGESFDNQTELQAIRIGPLVLFATPFEVFQAIKNDITAKAIAPIPLVMSLSNAEQGYAVDKISAEKGESYEARTVPLWKYTLPYKNIHEELVRYLLDLDAELFA